MDKINLTDMWKANGSNYTKRPVKWFGLPSTANLLEELQKDTKVQKLDFGLYRTQRGGKMPGTWGTHKVALAYAEYLSPESHIWCNEVVKLHIEYDANPEQGMSLLYSDHTKRWILKTL